MKKPPASGGIASRPEGRLCFGNQALTGILPILICHSFGPVLCTEVPEESTATVTGMFSTSNS